MTFRLRHEWTAGTALLTAVIATCAHCETLRVVEGSNAHWVKRALDPDRVLFAEPPCVSPAGFFRAPEVATQSQEETQRVQASVPTSTALRVPGVASSGAQLSFADVVASRDGDPPLG